MTIASEVTRINTNIASAYTACNEKGATMPDTQNSANLADTIESIPTGGSGSKDYSDADFDTINSIINNDITESRTVSQLLSLGWVQNASSASVTDLGHGFVLASSVDSIAFRKDITDFYRIPSSATAEEVTYNSVTFIKINFSVNSTERWYCITTSSLELQISGSYMIKIPAELGSVNLNSNTYYLRCYNCKTFRSNNELSDFLAPHNLWCYSLKKLKLFVPSGTSLSLSSIDVYKPAELKLLLSLDNLTDFLPIISGYDSTTQTVTLSDSSVDQLLGGNTSSNFITNVLPNINGKCPFIFDMTNVTSTGTWKCCSISADYATYIARVTNLKVKLPSRYTTINFFAYIANDACAFNLDMESWEYLATNAPTVSSKTLNISNAYHWLQATTRGQAVLSTLTSKGWTVGY